MLGDCCLRLQKESEQLLEQGNQSALLVLPGSVL